MALTFTNEEVRILGVLIEKQRATPDSYPMTVNALTAACNQKSNRNPVVSYTTSHVMRTLDTLHKRRVVGTTSGTSARVARYWHALDAALGVSDGELVVLCCLMLRGAQTVGEIRGRTTRLYTFDDLNAVETALNDLSTRPEAPLVLKLPRQPGQKEPRFVHLLSSAPDHDALVVDSAPSSGTSDAPDRVAHLEEDVARLRERLDALEAAFRAFTAQFE